MKNDPWDELSDTFSSGMSSSGNETEISAHAADNILIAWPPILGLLTEHVTANSSVLDFGCGSGGFANELHRRGYQVTGFDTSIAMIRNATELFGTNVNFVQGDPGALERLGTFAAVTSVMTLQFIADGQRAIAELAKHVSAGGVLVFAVHNPDHVKDWIALGRQFVEFDSAETPRQGQLCFGSGGFESGTSVPIHIRTADEYDDWAILCGLEPIFRATPPYTEEFLARYPAEAEGPTKHSRFLILGYRLLARFHDSLGAAGQHMG